jgi:hypothetical protein
MVSESRSALGETNRDPLMRGSGGQSAQCRNSVAGFSPPVGRRNLRGDGFTSSFFQGAHDALTLLVDAALCGAFIVSIVASFVSLLGIHL